MAKFVMKNAVINYDGRNLSGDLSSVTITSTRDIPETTAFGGSARTRIAGLLDTTIDHSGYWDAVSATDSLDADMFASVNPQSAESLVTVSPDGAALGDVAYMLQTRASTYTPGATIGEVFAFTINTSGNGPLVRGKVVTNAVYTTTTNGTQQALETLEAAETVVSIIHVTAASGTSPTLDVTVQSDEVAFSTPVTRMTHPQFTGVGADRQTLVGPITDDTDWRHVLTIGGGSPSFTVFGSIGIYQTLTP